MNMTSGGQRPDIHARLVTLLFKIQIYNQTNVFKSLFYKYILYKNEHCIIISVFFLFVFSTCCHILRQFISHSLCRCINAANMLTVSWLIFPMQRRILSPGIQIIFSF